MFVISSVITASACSDSTTDDSSTSTGSSSGVGGAGGKSTPNEEKDAGVCASERCEHPVNQCDGVLGELCISDQTNKVYQCQQKPRKICPEWVYLGDYIDAGK